MIRPAVIMRPPGRRESEHIGFNSKIAAKLVDWALQETERSKCYMLIKIAGNYEKPAPINKEKSSFCSPATFWVSKNSKHRWWDDYVR